jgi:hypothetical protein
VLRNDNRRMALLSGSTQLAHFLGTKSARFPDGRQPGAVRYPPFGTSIPIRLCPIDDGYPVPGPVSPEIPSSTSAIAGSSSRARK